MSDKIPDLALEQENAPPHVRLGDAAAHAQYGIPMEPATRIAYRKITAAEKKDLVFMQTIRARETNHPVYTGIGDINTYVYALTYLLGVHEKECIAVEAFEGVELPEAFQDTPVGVEPPPEEISVDYKAEMESAKERAEKAEAENAALMAQLGRNGKKGAKNPAPAPTPSDE